MKKNSWILYAGILGVCLIGVASFWLILWFFEGEVPSISMEPRPEVVGKETKIKVKAEDSKQGLRSVSLKIRQGEKEFLILDEKFEKKGWATGSGVGDFEKEVELKPADYGIKEGQVSIELIVRDHSGRNGGEGNLASIKFDTFVDTTPPSITPVSPYHYFNMGGTGVVVYRTSQDTSESGVKAGDRVFRGYKVTKDSNLWICYFPILEDKTSCHLHAKDRAGNTTSASFYYHIKPKKFKSDIIVVSDSFIQKILPYFESIGIPNSQGSLIEWFKYVNRTQRELDEKRFSELARDSSPEAMWEGPWLRMKNSAPMAGFGDKRTYRYQNTLVGESVHKGIDLASLQNSEVPASNSGKVVFCGDMGIYGKTVVIDHGQGIFSTYSHLSQISVREGQVLKKGETIGTTGSTGLAGGDHLHFGIMVQGVFVNPVEWWDPLWINEKILRWLRQS
jgi:hypothetical protein